MQCPCPRCGTRIVIDDAKVPDRAFQVRCPKCQTVTRFPGRESPLAEAAAPAEPPPQPSGSTEELRAQMMAQVRREMALGDVPSGRRALVAIADRSLAGAVTMMLSRLGYEVDPLDDAAEGARLMEQGVHDLVITTRAGAAPGKTETLYQRLSRLSPEARRRLFVVLVGDDLKTGDGTQAWACLVDLVLNTRDAGAADIVVRASIADKARLYQVFNEARRRHEDAAG